MIVIRLNCFSRVIKVVSLYQMWSFVQQVADLCMRQQRNTVPNFANLRQKIIPVQIQTAKIKSLISEIFPGVPQFLFSNYQKARPGVGHNGPVRPSVCRIEMYGMLCFGIYISDHLKRSFTVRSELP